MKSLLTGDLSVMTTAELVSLFERLCLAQAKAEEYFYTGRVNRFVLRRFKVLREMRHRAIDERRALFVLYDHPHSQVRLSVAKGTYALDPQRARKTMEKIASSRQFPWAGEAGMSLALLQDGISLLPNDPELGRP